MKYDTTHETITQFVARFGPEITMDLLTGAVGRYTPRIYGRETETFVAPPVMEESTTARKVKVTKCWFSLQVREDSDGMPDITLVRHSIVQTKVLVDE